MSTITRPALKYFGSKFRIAPWILKHLPDHNAYVEPFCGGASVLLRKPPSPFEVLNDLDSNVVNFFKVLRERTEDLRRVVELTPFSREEVELAAEDTSDELEKARRFYIRSWQTQHGAPYTKGNNGWRFGRRGGNDKRSAVDDWNATDRMPAIARRLKNVQIEHDDALATIKRFDGANVVFYCDPPYVAETRYKRWASNGYEHEMTDADHRALAKLLHEIEGMALVSGYPGTLYAELYKDWKMVSRKNYTGHSAEPRTEGLWISKRAQDRLHQKEFFAH